MIDAEERRGPFIKYDFLGTLDLIAKWKGRAALLGVQTTTVSHMADHLSNMRASRELREKWLDDGNLAECWLYPERKDRTPHPSPQRVPVT